MHCKSHLSPVTEGLDYRHQAGLQEGVSKGYKGSDQEGLHQMSILLRSSLSLIFPCLVLGKLLKAMCIFMWFSEKKSILFLIWQNAATKVWGKPKQPPSNFILPWCLSDETQRETPHYNLCEAHWGQQAKELSLTSKWILCQGTTTTACSGTQHTATLNPAVTLKQMVGEEHRNGIITCDTSPEYSCTQLHHLELRESDMVSLVLVTQWSSLPWSWASCIECV